MQMMKQNLLLRLSIIWKFILITGALFQFKLLHTVIFLKMILKQLLLSN